MIHKKVKPAFLLVVVVCSFVANLFVMAANTQAAANPAQVYIAQNALSDATRSAYRISLAMCVAGAFREGRPSADVATGDWFQSNIVHVRPGIVVFTDADRVLDCGTLVKNHPVAQILGYQDNIALACGMGAVRSNGGDCLNDPQQSGFSVKNNRDVAGIMANLDRNAFTLPGSVQLNFTRAPDNGYNDAQIYTIAAKTFMEYCKAIPKANVSGAAPAIQAQYKDNVAKVVSREGDLVEIVDVYFDIPDKGKEAYIRNFDTGGRLGDWQKSSCNEIKNLMNGTAGAYWEYVERNKANDGGGAPLQTGTGGTTANNKSSCVVAGIGWILCPIINNFLAPVIDASYAFVASLLTVQPLLLANGNTVSSVYETWAVMRNIANVVFVIAFLFILFSQLTSVGITNYGIKRMLPRLIVAAILVNSSYWICALAVDLSNIIGSSVYGLFIGINNALPATDTSAINTGNGAFATISGLILAGGVAVGVALFIGLSALLPILVSALAIIVTVFILLIARQAAIILLTVVSPLALVAYLLPNTESLFRKWRKLFTALLAMFPLIGLAFGASALASKVIIDSAPKTDYEIVFQVAGLGVSILGLPLGFLLIRLGSGVIGKFVGNNPNKGPIDSLQKKAGAYRQQRMDIATARRLGRSQSVLGGDGGTLGETGTRRRRTAAWFAGSGASTPLNAQQRQENAKKALQKAQQDYLVDRLAGDTNDIAKQKASEKYAQSLAGPTGDSSRIIATAAAVQQREISTAIGDAELSADFKPGDVASMAQALGRAVQEGDSITARAMQNLLLKSGGPGISAYRNTIKNLEDNGQMNAGVDNALRLNITTNHSNMKKSANDIMTHATRNAATLSEAGNSGKTWTLADEDLASQKSSSMDLAMKATNADGKFAVSREQAERILDNPELSKSIPSPELRNLLLARAGRQPSTPAPTP